MSIINSTETIRLAREAIAWWEEQPDAQVKRELFLKEPQFVQRARAVLNSAKLRFHVEPRGIPAHPVLLNAIFGEFK